jgi:hypothetical protein
VQLVLELQLVVAGLVQRLRTAGQQQRQSVMQHYSELLLLRDDQMLQVQIRGVLQMTGASCLPPEVLQQAGLQLLQALAAPLQQLQLGYPSGSLAGLSCECKTLLIQQLLTLRTAGAGMPRMQYGVMGRCCCCCCFDHGVWELAALWVHFAVHVGLVQRPG